MPPNPKHQFILDLQAWLTSLTNQGHDLIVSLDVNDTYNPDILSSSCHLAYTEGKPVMNTLHDGNLATLISSCNLIDPLSLQHPQHPYPASHLRDSSRIDFIFISCSLLLAVIRSGSLSLHSLFLQGDHGPYYLDLDSKIRYVNLSVFILDIRYALFWLEPIAMNIEDCLYLLIYDLYHRYQQFLQPQTLIVFFSIQIRPLHEVLRTRVQHHRRDIQITRSQPVCPGVPWT